MQKRQDLTTSQQSLLSVVLFMARDKFAEYMALTDLPRRLSLQFHSQYDEVVTLQELIESADSVTITTETP